MLHIVDSGGVGMADMYRSRGSHSIIWFFLLLMIIIGGGLFWLEVKISPLVEAVAKEKAQTAVIKIIQESIARQVASDLHYEDVMEVYRDDNGKIVLMAPNYGTINTISSNVFLDVENSMRHMATEEIDVPFGTILGSRLFATAGPDIPIKVFPIGKIDVNLSDEFIQAGINQIKHRVSVEVTVEVKVLIPFYGEEMIVSSGAPVCESIIIGDIPNTYFNMSGNQMEHMGTGLSGLLSGGSMSGN